MEALAKAIKEKGLKTEVDKKIITGQEAPSVVTSKKVEQAIQEVRSWQALNPFIPVDQGEDGE